jgi:hypothetical protein
MNCPEYQNLNIKEKHEFIGRLLHAAQCDSIAFSDAQKLINKASIRGVLEDVVIWPERQEEPETEK